jgi:hypothetical protein
MVLLGVHGLQVSPKCSLAASLASRTRVLAAPWRQVQKDSELQWYMLQTANGFEGTVERTIKMATQAQRLHDKIEQVQAGTASSC